MRALWWKTSLDISASLHQIQPLLVPSEWLNASCISAASNMFLPCMSAASAPSTHLDRLREDGTLQLVTWEWDNFLCPCFEIKRDRRKKTEKATYLIKEKYYSQESISAVGESQEQGLRGWDCQSALLPSLLLSAVAAGGKATCTGGHCTFSRLCQDSAGWLVFCFLFVLCPPRLPKTTSQAEFQGQSIWFFQELEFSVILLQFEVVSVDALKHSLFCVLSHSALAADRLKNQDLILPVVVFGQTMQALCIA